GPGLHRDRNRRAAADEPSLTDAPGGHRSRKRTLTFSGTVCDGAGSFEQIEGRVKQIRSQIEESTSDYELEKLQECVAKLKGDNEVQNVGIAIATRAMTEPPLE
ncbi:MAG: hypothetical protein EHM68_10080, partial [Lysobacterales bacterium]